LGFVFALAVLWLARPTGTTLAWGAFVAAIGEALRIWAAGHLNKSREVTSSGPYRWFAHPLYIGSSVMGIGLAIASGSVWVTTLITVYLGVTVTAAITNEEAFLRRTFGVDYDRYRQGKGGDVRRRFSLAQAMANREPRAIAGLAMAVLLLALKAMYYGMFWRTAGTR
jgi:protein-S-isoprenylcysteine O-methyltransferase Ste14